MKALLIFPVGLLALYAMVQGFFSILGAANLPSGGSAEAAKGAWTLGAGAALFLAVVGYGVWLEAWNALFGFGALIGFAVAAGTFVLNSQTPLQLGPFPFFGGAALAAFCVIGLIARFAARL